MKYSENCGVDSEELRRELGVQTDYYDIKTDCTLQKLPFTPEWERLAYQSLPSQD